MLIEATGESVLYEWPHGEFRFLPGKPLEVEEYRALKILKRCGSRVRQVLPAREGSWIEFNSPLFGLCLGRILKLDIEFIRLGDHSVTSGTVTIPSSWMVRTINE